MDPPLDLCVWQEMLTARVAVKLNRVGRANGSHVSETEITEDAILGGRVRLRQPARGYRVNVDTILLAAAIEAHPGARLMEAGCGVGAAALAVAVRSENTRIVGIERDQNIAQLARENVALNAMSARVEIVTGDALARDANWGVFEGVFVNPPFDQAGEGRPPSEARRHAHIADAPIAEWVAALADRLSGGGALTMIHRAAKLPEILAALSGRLGGVEVFPVRPNAAVEAKRVLVRARKGSRAALKLLKGLDLHDASSAQKYTVEAEAILRGEAVMEWGVR